MNYMPLITIAAGLILLVAIIFYQLQIGKRVIADQYLRVVVSGLRGGRRDDVPMDTSIGPELARDLAAAIQHDLGLKLRLNPEKTQNNIALDLQRLVDLDLRP